MTFYFKKLIYLIIFLHFSSFCISQNDLKPMSEPDLFKNKLKEFSTTTKSIESTFIQNKNLSILAKPLISKGVFYYKKDKKVRWEYTEPFKYLIIINDTKIFIKDKSNSKQYDTQSNKMFQELNNFLIGCITGELLNNNKDFSISFKENSKLYNVELVPKNIKMSKMLTKIVINFNKNDLSVDELKMYEQNNDNTVINFYNKKLNTTVADEKFNFN